MNFGKIRSRAPPGITSDGIESDHVQNTPDPLKCLREFFSHIQRFQMDPVLFEDKPKNISSADNYDLEPHTITKSISASIILLELPL